MNAFWGYNDSLLLFAETKLFAGVTDVGNLCRTLRTYETEAAKFIDRNQISHDMFSCMWGLLKHLAADFVGSKD